MSETSYDALYYPSYIPKVNWIKVQLLLWDRIHRIVPWPMQRDVGDHYVNDVLDLNPAYLPVEDPSISDLEYFEKRRRALETATDRVAAENQRDFVPTEEVTGIHPNKAPQWVFDMLQKKGLTRGEPREDGSWVERHYLVQRDAADLIMSCLASQMAKRRGLYGITDRVASLNLSIASEIVADDLRIGESAVQALGMQVYQIHVPHDLTDRSFAEIIKIREEYADLRKAFHRSMRGITRDHGLEGIVDRKRFEEVLQDCVQDFDAETEKLKRGMLSRLVRDWRIQAIGIAIGGLGAALAGGPVTAIALGSAATATALSNAVVDRPEEPDIQQAVRYLHILDRELDPVMYLEGLTGFLKQSRRRYLPIWRS